MSDKAGGASDADGSIQAQPAAHAERPEEVQGALEPWAFVCYASSCRYQGAEATAVAIAQELRRRAEQSGQPQPEARVGRAGCFGLCNSGPVVATYPGGEMHIGVRPEDAREMAAQLANGKGLARRAVKLPVWYQEYLRTMLARLAGFARRATSK